MSDSIMTGRALTGSRAGIAKANSKLRSPTGFKHGPTLGDLLASMQKAKQQKYPKKHKGPTVSENGRKWNGEYAKRKEWTAEEIADLRNFKIKREMSNKDIAKAFSITLSQAKYAVALFVNERQDPRGLQDSNKGGKV